MYSMCNIYVLHVVCDVHVLIYVVCIYGMYVVYCVSVCGICWWECGMCGMCDVYVLCRQQFRKSGTGLLELGSQRVPGP